MRNNTISSHLKWVPYILFCRLISLCY
jgi:hypothetical protein